MSKARDARRVLPWLVEEGLILEWSEVPDDQRGERVRFKVQTSDGRFRSYTSREVLAFFAGSCSRGDRERDGRDQDMPDVGLHDAQGDL